MTIKTTALLISSLLLSSLVGCSGISDEELRRQQLLAAQRAEAAARQAEIEAQQRQQRIDQRIQAADQAWAQQQQLSTATIDGLFDHANNQNQSQLNSQVFFQRFELQPAKYNYRQGYQPFSVVGLRTLPNSSNYKPLFPDESASYQPGQSAKSVMEFVLKQDTEKNRIGQDVLKAQGQRWVAATLNAKKYPLLEAQQKGWQWQQSLFEDLSWQQKPEMVYPYTKDKSLTVQIGLRFCFMPQRCSLSTQYREHPTEAVRAEIISVLIADKNSQEILARFIRPAP